MKTTNAFRFALVWVAGAFSAVLMSMNPLSAAYVGGQYIPVGNDSFYHARRILDTVADPQNFYQFDAKIHAPEGSMLTWPWAYDYAVAGIVRFMLSTGLASDPMKVMDYLPVFAILISVALVIGIASALELPWFGALLLALSVAFSSLTQTVHGVGNIDHHFVEYIFVLAAFYLGLRWLRALPSRYRAAGTAALFGVAPAFQNGLFILQLPLLIALAILWMRGVRMPRSTALTFAAVLVATTLAAAIPSQPFREGSFEFYFLSWFHLYVACCTAGLVVASAFVMPTPKTAAAIGAGAALAAIPLISQVLIGSSFLAGHLGVLHEISEVKGVLRIAADHGIAWVIQFYSLLIFVAPLALMGCAWVAARRQTEPQLLYMCVFCVCGLTMLFLQFRLHIFGSLALVLPWVVLIYRVDVSSARQRAVVVAAAAALIAAAYVPSVKDQLFDKRAPGNDVYYGLTRSIYPAMAEACAARPGVVLASSDVGHYIRFHTQCSVIADNFLIMPLHFQKFLEARRLMTLTPTAVLESGTPVRYIYVTLADVAVGSQGKDVLQFEADKLSQAQPRLVAMLLFGELQSIDPRLRLVKELRMQDSIPVARLFEVVSGPVIPATSQ
jgi:asparagine N-glycosylation enzyme membrane subunit Stt3